MTREHEQGRPGDSIEVRSTVDAPARRGRILEVLGHDEHVHYRVRWDDEHESILYPAHAEFTIHRRAAERA